MPSATSGFTGTEIVTHVANYLGNQSAEFSTLVGNMLPLAEYRFCKGRDWKFLKKQNLSLTVSSGTDAYSLTTGTIGFYMKAEDVESIWNATDGLYLQKVDLATLRRMDLKQDDGSTSTNITHWAPVGDNQIVVYPKVFKDTALKIDGKIQPTALTTLSNYPTIPFQYQEAFIKYVIAQAMERENDARADSAKQEAMILIRQDIQDDVGSGSNSADEPRIKSQWEAARDGIGGDLEAAWVSSLFS